MLVLGGESKEEARRNHYGAPFHISQMIVLQASPFALRMLQPKASMYSAPLPAWAFYAAIAYFVGFTLAIGGVFIWWAKRRKERPPEKFKLLRGPGETQRRRVQSADEDTAMYLFLGAFAPLFVSWLTLFIATRIRRSFAVTGLALATVILVGGLYLSGHRLFRFLRRRRDDLLGYLGERAVAEQLEALRKDGFRIFHDVPCQGRKNDFNIDHVVVGPTGIGAIEVKTRRKKKGLPGREEHVVHYDGQRLIWPWGEDRCGIEQVQAEADWLRGFIEKRTGLKIHPKPIVVFPGWMVKERSLGHLRVANHKIAPSIVREWNPQPLSAGQIDLISRQLDELCRDVED